MEFNILDVLDSSIDNIDLTKSYVYVLELEDNRYYIGRTSNFMQRMKEHFIEGGAIYTKKYKPIKIKEVIEEISCYHERDKTIEYMEIYGWEKVRGYAWCRETLLRKPKISKKKSNNEKTPYIVYDEEYIINMYLLENKDIIQIGKALNRSPGSIAYSLEKMGMVDRRQLSRGYFDYIFSDLYDEYKKNKIAVKETCDYPILKQIDIAEKTDLTKEELLNVKSKIRTMVKCL
jgi:predicted GIY-YIG superfamily endonuclease